MAVIVADRRGVTDGAMYNLADRVNATMPILLISRPDGYEFNEQVLALAGKPYLIWDVVEYGWDAKIKTTHFFGVNTGDFSPLFFGEAWSRLDEFIAANKPVGYFKRELLGRDVRTGVYPLNYPAQNEIPTTQTREVFEQRPLDVFYNWGLSHEDRKRLHGEIWQKAGQYGYVVCDSPYYLSGFIQNENNPHRWATINTPHYYRQPIETVIGMNGLAKISISMPGAGRVCFRHTESPLNAVMLMVDDGIKWSYDWVHNVNCLKSEQGGEIETIIEALKNPNLYDIYLAGVENCKKYYIDTYISEYINPIINSL